MSGMLAPTGGPVRAAQDPDEPPNHTGMPLSQSCTGMSFPMEYILRRHTALRQTSLTLQFRKQTQRGQGISQSCTAKRRHAWDMN